MTRVRAAVPGDAGEVARLHVRSWQHAYRGLVAQEYLDRLTPDQVAGRYAFGRVGLRTPSTFVAIDGSAICGFATIGLCRDEALPNCGELMAIYVDPARLRTGVGQLLMAAARARLRLVGVPSAVLWVLGGNAPARRFYEHDGWLCDGAWRIEHFGDVEVSQLRYRRAPV